MTVVDDVAGTLLVVEVLTLSDFAVAAVVTPLYAERTLEPVLESISSCFSCFAPASSPPAPVSSRTTS